MASVKIIPIDQIDDAVKFHRSMVKLLSIYNPEKDSSGKSTKGTYRYERVFATLGSDCYLVSPKTKNLVKIDKEEFRSLLGGNNKDGLKTVLDSAMWDIDLEKAGYVDGQGFKNCSAMEIKNDNMFFDGAHNFAQNRGKGANTTFPMELHQINAFDAFRNPTGLGVVAKELNVLATRVQSISEELNSDDLQRLHQDAIDELAKMNLDNFSSIDF